MSQQRTMKVTNYLKLHLRISEEKEFCIFFSEKYFLALSRRCQATILEEQDNLFCINDISTHVTNKSFLFVSIFKNLLSL
jgi:uncharacterized membrane protein